MSAVAGGLSRRAAAERFGVSAASAIRWVHASNTTGTLEAKLQSGDMRLHYIKVLGPVILAGIKARKDISLVELAGLLRSRYDASFTASMVWRFLDRHAMTFKNVCVWIPYAGAVLVQALVQPLRWRGWRTG